MAYFDSAYFDPAYFDTDAIAAAGGSVRRAIPFMQQPEQPDEEEVILDLLIPTDEREAA